MAQEFHSFEEARQYRKDRGLSPLFYQYPLNTELLGQYPEIPAEAWLVLQYMRSFMGVSNIAKHIEGDIEYYWFDHTTIISLLYVFGITNQQKLYRLFCTLSGLDTKSVPGKPYFLKPFCKRELIGSRTFYAFTPICLELFQGVEAVREAEQHSEDAASGETGDDPAPEKPPAIDFEGHEFSRKFLLFVESLGESPKFQKASLYDKRSKSKRKNRYAVMADLYLTALLDGTFLEKFGSGLSEPKEKHVAFRDLTNITFSEILEAALQYGSPTQELKFSDVFIQPNKPVSPVLNFISRKRLSGNGNTYEKAKDIPVIKESLTPEEVAELPRKLQYVYGYTGEFSGKPNVHLPGINDVIGDPRTPFYGKYFVAYDRRIKQIYDKMDTFCHDYGERLQVEGERKIDAERLTNIYVKYLQAQKSDWVEKQLEGDIRYMRPGDMSNSNFRAFVAWVYFHYDRLKLTRDRPFLNKLEAREQDRASREAYDLTVFAREED